MDKSAIIRKLTNPFSYSTVEIPTTAKIEGQTIDLKQRILGLARISEDKDPVNVLPEVVRLEYTLSRLFDDFKSKVEYSQIDLNEAESQLEYYLGIKRAIVILKGVSDGSLRPFREDDERKQRTEDKKRWYKSTKKLAEE